MKKKHIVNLAAMASSILFFQNTAWSKSSLLMQLPPILASKRTASSAVLNENLFVIDGKNIADIVDVNAGASEESVLILSGNLAEKVNTGHILYIFPGSDNRFPFGFSGKVTSLTENADGTKNVNLEEISFSEVFKESHFNINEISLNEENFIGSISPSGINNVLINGVQKKTFSKNNIVSPDMGVISFEDKINIAKFEPLLNTMSPIIGSVSADFIVNATMDKLRFSEQHEFSNLFGLDYGVKSIYARMSGNLNAEIKLSGKGFVKFGWPSKAWQDIKERGWEDLGIKFTGLSPDDKIGKFPLVGLVWSLGFCSGGCVTFPGQTQPALSQGHIGAVILWLYLVADGEMSLDGTVGARVYPSKLSLGVQKPYDGDYHIISSLDRTGSTKLMEAPKLNGMLKMQGKIGITAEADILIGGVRIANIGADLVALKRLHVIGDDLSYGTEDLHSWNWSNADYCPLGSIGAGLIARAAVGVGVKLSTTHTMKLDYKFQIPTDQQMDIPGWHGLWFTKIENPVEATSLTGRIWMDRNLGACKVAASPTSTMAYGDLYQWGRLTDGHEKRNSNITSTLSSNDNPGHTSFITAFSASSDWREPQNNELWQGINGMNNPCPEGFRLPTSAELQEEINSWSSKDAAGAFASPLKLTTGGQRSPSIVFSGVNGLYWSSTTNGVFANCMHFHDTNGSFNKEAIIYKIPREFGMSVRCIKE